MKKSEEDGLRIITAEEGYVFCTKDKTEVFGNIIYLGNIDSEENYIEITVDEAEKIKAAQDSLET